MTCLQFFFGHLEEPLRVLVEGQRYLTQLAVEAVLLHLQVLVVLALKQQHEFVVTHSETVIQ